MKTTLICPKCEGRKIWHEPSLTAELSDGSVGKRPAFLGWRKTLMASLESFGHVETFTCAGCGYRETYAQDLVSFEQSVTSGRIRATASLIDNTPKATLR